ncbi:SAM-dependent methyltransferase [Micromonospora sp. WMMD737]|uniref:SAM-dependent methyltransferase n=1 Tax=Micromonospora sp. WMMD737 TaxID=3404113 RepID=UPI003B95D10D
MSDDDRLRWDRRHAGQDPVELDEVALPAVFRPYATEFPVAGRALELACGRGAAAVWLALRGMDVRGVDISPAAVEAARGLARRCRIAERCHFDIVDLDDGLPPGKPVDVLLCNKFRDQRLDHPVLERLAPGGLLALSALSEVGAGPGPFRVRPGELTDAFAVLDVITSGEADGQAWLLARR